MDISSIAGNLVHQYQIASNHSAQQSQASPDPVATAFKRANERVEQQLEKTKVQLSSYGQIKGAVAELQTASQTLSDSKKTATSDDIKKAAESFVSAYNKANSTVSTATQSEGKQTAALADDARARLASSDLRRSLQQGSNAADLKKIGITLNKDGSLSVDSKTLESALKSDSSQVRSTLSAIGQQVDKTATRELASSGNVGGSVNSLTNRSHALETQQSAQQTQMAESQRNVESQTSHVSNAVANGLAAYQRMMSG